MSHSLITITLGILGLLWSNEIERVLEIQASRFLFRLWWCACNLKTEIRKRRLPLKIVYPYKRENLSVQ